MIELTNKKLSETFGINFAKWKRWSREFLGASDQNVGKRTLSYTEQYMLESFKPQRCGVKAITSIKFINLSIILEFFVNKINAGNEDEK